MGTADQCAARWLRRSRFAQGSNRAVPSREQPLSAAQGTNRFMIAVRQELPYSSHPCSSGGSSALGFKAVIYSPPPIGGDVPTADSCTAANAGSRIETRITSRLPRRSVPTALPHNTPTLGRRVDQPLPQQRHEFERRKDGLHLRKRQRQY